MPLPPNTLRWDGRPGHYEVYYVTLTDPASGVGLWIRYTMVSPLPAAGGTARAALWFVAFDPRREDDAVLARKRTVAVERLSARQDPFELRLGDAVLSSDGMAGTFDDVAWELRWTPSGRPYHHVQPVAERLGLAQTVLELPEADLAIEGTVAYGGTRLELAGARGGQAHLWGTKHAEAWAWVH